MKKFLFKFGGYFCFLLTLVAAFGGWKAAQQMQASAGWPKTTGKVTQSQLMGLEVGRRGAVKADIRYEYQVVGSSYTGSRIRLGDSTSANEEAQSAILESYPVGAEVDVYYDPQEPRQSVLEPGGGARRFAMALPALIMAGIGVLLIKAGREA